MRPLTCGRIVVVGFGPEMIPTWLVYGVGAVIAILALLVLCGVWLFLRLGRQIAADERAREKGLSH